LFTSKHTGITVISLVLVFLKMYTLNEQIFKPLDEECLRLDSDTSRERLSYGQWVCVCTLH